MHVATLLNVPPIVYFLDELEGRIRKAHHSFKDEHKEKKNTAFYRISPKANTKVTKPT